MDRMIIVVLALALGYFAVDKFVLDPARDAAGDAAKEAVSPLGADSDSAAPAAAAPAVDIKSIAVLAFANMRRF
jgi:hypothetical protein